MKRNDCILINSAQLEEKILNKYVNFHRGTGTEGRNYVYEVIISRIQCLCIYIYNTHAMSL